MKTNKLKVIKDYKNLSDEMKEQIKLTYSDGYSQYLIEFKNSKGENITALPFETDDRIYMVKMSVQRTEKVKENESDYDDNDVIDTDVNEKNQEEPADIEYSKEDEDEDDEEN